MRIFTAGLVTETNTFSPWATGARGFAIGRVFRGDASRTGAAPENLTARLWRERAEADGHDFGEGLFAFAEPSGPVVQEVYAGFRDEILTALDAGDAPDVVLLWLHGAMVSGECEDCEGDLLARVRAHAPDAVVGALLDPHCHLTGAMVAAADALIIIKNYPHDDFLERGNELYDLCTRAATGECRPVSAVFDCRMIGFYPTTSAPMSDLVAGLSAAEREPGVLSASYVHGFPWGDVRETGSKALVIADGNRDLAARTAELLGRRLYAAREQLLPRYMNIDEALDAAAATLGRIVVADTADNSGGGAPSDNVTLLRAMLDHKVEHAAFGCIWDPIAANACADAGVGAQICLRIGGKCGPASGEYLDLTVRVRAISEAHDQTGLGFSRVPMGLSVWVSADGVDIVLNSIRTQTFAPDAFTGLGIDLTDKRLIAVKSSHHFHAAFAPIADRIIPVATPGAIQMDFANIPYRRRRDLNFFPRVADPLPAA